VNNFDAYLLSILPVSDGALKALHGICTTQRIAKNEDLQPIGHTCKTIYFVDHGALRIYYFKEDIDITESFEFENSMVARAESLFSKSPSRKAIQALEPTHLVCIDANALETLYDDYHELERLFRLIFEKILVKTVQRLESLQFYNAEERYNNLITDHPNIVKRVALKHIASYLGITPVSLSRIRGKR